MSTPTCPETFSYEEAQVQQKLQVQQLLFALNRLKNERDAALAKVLALQQEFDTIKARNNVPLDVYVKDKAEISSPPSKALQMEGKAGSSDNFHGPITSQLVEKVPASAIIEHVSDIHLKEIELGFVVHETFNEGERG